MKHESGALKEVMTRENITWRTFDDDGTINRAWNSPATPTFFILDREGVIRHKWIGLPGEKVVDAAVEKWMAATASIAPKQPLR